MKKLTFITSFILIILGLIGYFGAYKILGASKQSITSLIPSIIGVFILIGAIISIKKYMLGIHLCVLVAFLGLLAGVSRVITLIVSKGFNNLINGPFIIVLLMTLICLLYVFVSIKFFIKARRSK